MPRLGDRSFQGDVSDVRANLSPEAGVLAHDEPDRVPENAC
jgi:hypothetical protein